MKNMKFSSNENIDYSQSTKKTFGSRNLFVLVMAILATASDFALMVVFAIAGHGGIAIPIVLLILDGLFIAGVCLSNFRFKYSIGIWVAYIVVSVIITSILATLNSGATYMTETAKYLNVFSHLVLYIVTVFASIYPLFKNSVKLKAVMVTATAIAIILVGSFAIFFSSNGYFGQGFVGESRVVGYTLDEDSDTYIATSIKNGRSDKVIIPEEFNGKKVSGVNCSIFTHTSIKTVEIQSKEKIVLEDTQLLMDINQELRIGVDKKFIDEYRKDFLQRPWYASPSSMTEPYVTFSNSLYPINLEDNERYITFAYEDAPKQGEIIPTWIGKSGETFQLSFASEVDYMQHANHDSVEDLVWCYDNNESKILTGEILTHAGSKIDANLDCVKIQFENVYVVKVEEDNDEKYEPSNDFKKTTLNGKIYDYRFVTLGTANALLAQLPAREGFDLSWGYKTTRYMSYKPLDTLRDAVYDLDEGSTLIYVSPIWNMKAPTGLTINFDKSRYEYGDDVNMSATANVANKDFKLQYDWSYDGNGNNSALTGEKYGITNALPQSGNFTLKVTVTYDGSSLSSESEVSGVLQVNKKALNFIWTEPDNMVYDGTEKSLGYRCGDDELINGDFLANKISENEIRNTNAGQYVAMISLRDDIFDKYYIASGETFAYTIAPRPTEITWTCGDFTYDGEYHSPSASAKNVYGSNLPLLLMSPVRFNAGKYTEIVNCSDSNYQLINSTYDFEIKQKGVELQWDNSTIIYSGYAQYPKVAQVYGLVGDDNINGELVYSGYSSNIDAGDGYTVKVTLPASSNYKFDREQTKSYNISKRALRVRTLATDKTYDGINATFDFEVVSGLASIHTKNDLGHVIYSGGLVGSTIGLGLHAVDAGDYVVQASLLTPAATINYDITVESATFTIHKARVSISWMGASVNDEEGVVTPPRVIENAQAYSGDIVIERYIYKDSLGRVIDSIPYESGTYSVEVVATSKNYEFTNVTRTFNVTVTVIEEEQEEVA